MNKYKDVSRMTKRSIKIKKLSHFLILYNKNLDKIDYCIELCKKYNSDEILKYINENYNQLK